MTAIAETRSWLAAASHGASELCGDITSPVTLGLKAPIPSTLKTPHLVSNYRGMFVSGLLLNLLIVFQHRTSANIMCDYCR
jgi:hypothetical protein